MANINNKGFGGHLVVLFGPSCGSVPLLATTNKPITAELTQNVLKKYNEFLEAAPLKKFGIKKEVILLTIPSILVDIANSGNQEMEHLASTTKGVIYAGAGLSEDIGDLLADNGVNLTAGYGM
jgi:hypothetical protein